MVLGRVIGTLVASRKEPTLDGLKLLVVRACDVDGTPTGAIAIAADAVGAGLGEVVLYAAVQGEEFENLRFWDAVDYIGLNNYYPLPDSLDCSGVIAKVEGIQKRFGKPLIFTEAGYSSLTAPHKEPWDDRAPREISLEAQARCYEALCKAVYRKPWFQGVYWWKVGTNGFGGAQDRSHTPWNKPAWQVVSRWYRTGGR